MEQSRLKRTIALACILCGAGIAATASGQVAGDAGAPSDAGPAGEAAAPAEGGAPGDAGTPATGDDGGSTFGANLRCNPIPTVNPIADDGGPVVDDGGFQVPNGDIWAAVGVAKPDAPEFDFSAVKAPYTTPADCKTYDPMDGHSAARNCLCDKPDCFTFLQECDSMPGCEQILKCAWDSNGLCNQALACYFGPCGTIIDQWGNTSLQAFVSQKVGTCGQAAGCPAQ